MKLIIYYLVVNSLSSSTITIRNSSLYNRIVKDTTVYTIGSNTYNGIKEVIESKHTLVLG